MSMAYIRSIGRALGLTLTRGNGKPYQTCAEAKARQKTVPKIGTGVAATVPNEWLYHNLALIKVPQDLSVIIRCLNRELYMDKAIGMGYLWFHKHKDNILDTATPILLKLEKMTDFYVIRMSSRIGLTSKKLYVWNFFTEKCEKNIIF